jgi:hypothetical protein
MRTFSGTPATESLKVGSSKLIDCMELSPSWGADCRPTGQEMDHLLWNTKVYCRPCWGSHHEAPCPGQSKWDLWWTRWHWDMFSPTFSVYPCQYHSTVLHTHISPGVNNRPWWSQFRDIVSPHRREQRGSLRCLQDSFTGPYPNADDSSSQPLAPFL